MTHPYRSRAHLEALLVATAIVHRRDPRVVLADVDRDRVSPACWHLLAQLADPAHQDVRHTTKAQQRLAEHVDAITIEELLFFSYEALIAEVNALPERQTTPAAWERDLARAQANARGAAA